MTMTTTAKPGWSTRNTVLVAVVLSAIAGTASGYATSYLTRTTVPSPQTRPVYLFTTTLNFDETNASKAFGTDIPHDYFAPDRITVNQGDKVLIRYYNTEDKPENHTFTMSYSSYNFNKVLQFQQVADFNFTADTPGVFRYECTFHQPTMTGYLVVLG